MENQIGTNERKVLIDRLKGELMSLQGYRAPSMGAKQQCMGLGPIEAAFPYGVFPKTGMHEFISDAPEQAAATSGFMAALAGQLMKQDGMCIWVSTRRTLFPLALGGFGVAADRVIFIDLKKDKDLLWTIEEGLKCKALSAVIGEIKDLDLTESRRLQLAIEDSKVTGLLHRICPRRSNPVSSLCRWRISPLPSQEEDLPGLGFPRWEVTIEKVRNGLPGKWEVKWKEDHFEHIVQQVPTAQELSRVG